MSDKWLEIACDIPIEYSDVLSAYLTELSGNGVCLENLNVDAFSHSEIVHQPIISIKAYFSSTDDINARLSDIQTFLAQLAIVNPGLSIPEPVVSEVSTEDWSSSWKSNFKPLRIGKKLLVVPSWEEVRAEPGDMVLRLDPGMAFGTGGHETTRLCLELLEQIMSEKTSNRALSVLDLGTGSGILAMAAVKMGAEPVDAVDIDPLAIEVAMENLAVNDMAENVTCSSTPIESITSRYDIILANILAEELVRLAPEILRCLKPGGSMVLSGILAEKEAFVLTGFSPFPVNHLETRHEGEWVALHYRKADNP